jgi:hypothetical protein
MTLDAGPRRTERRSLEPFREFGYAFCFNDSTRYDGFRPSAGTNAVTVRNPNPGDSNSAGIAVTVTSRSAGNLAPKTETHHTNPHQRNCR